MKIETVRMGMGCFAWNRRAYHRGRVHASSHTTSWGSVSSPQK